MITEETESAVHEAGWNKCEPSSVEAQSHKVFHIERGKGGKKKKKSPKIYVRSCTIFRVIWLSAGSTTVTEQVHAQDVKN